MALLLIISLLILIVFSVPIAIDLGLASIIGIFSIYGEGIPVTSVAQKTFNSIDQFPLMAVPFFILAGNIMSKGGISDRLINLATALTAHLHGGLGIVTV